jgi:hypothetical protein
MKHLNLEMEKLEQRIAPGAVCCSCGGGSGSKGTHKSGGSKSHHSGSHGSKGSGGSHGSKSHGSK